MKVKSQSIWKKKKDVLPSKEEQKDEEPTFQQKLRKPKSQCDDIFKNAEKNTSDIELQSSKIESSLQE